MKIKLKHINNKRQPGCGSNQPTNSYVDNRAIVKKNEVKPQRATRKNLPHIIWINNKRNCRHVHLLLSLLSATSILYGYRVAHAYVHSWHYPIHTIRTLWPDTQLKTLAIDWQKSNVPTNQPTDRRAPPRRQPEPEFQTTAFSDNNTAATINNINNIKTLEPRW